MKRYVSKSLIVLAVITSSIVVAGITPTQTSAESECGFNVSEEDCARMNFYANNEIWAYDYSYQSCLTDTEPSIGGSTSESDLVGTENLQKIYNFFISKGLTKEQAAGAVGNIDHESGGYPARRQGRPPSEHYNDPSGISAGWGIIQWTPGSKVLGIAKQAGITGPIHELSTQLDIVWWHMENSSPTGYRNFNAKYKEITDVTVATKFYMDKMEAPGKPQFDKRLASAKRALNYPIDAAGSSNAAVSTETNCSGSNTDAFVGTDGYAFPVLAKKAELATPRQGLSHLPCKNTTNPTACHHSPWAFDISTDAVGSRKVPWNQPTGVMAVAISKGTIAKLGTSYDGIKGCLSIQFKSDDGYMYWYGHTVNPKVSVGQQLEAGQVISEIGPTKCARNTVPHLHIDRGSPKGSAGGSPGRRDPGIVPLINSLYEQMP